MKEKCIHCGRLTQDQGARLCRSCWEKDAMLMGRAWIDRDSIQSIITGLTFLVKGINIDVDISTAQR